MTNIYLGNGKDVLTMSSPDIGWGTQIFGQNGADRITLDLLQLGDVFVSGGNGRDEIVLWSSDGNALSGDNGNDILRAFGTDNRLCGGSGADILEVGPGSSSGSPAVASFGNVLDGGRGDDLLISTSFVADFGRPAYPAGLGNTLTGGAGRDSFQLTGRGDLHVTNEAGDGVVSDGDEVRGLMDVITDYRRGEVLDIAADARVDDVAVTEETPHFPTGFGERHQHLVLADGAYAAFRGTYEGPGSFTVDAGGGDLLVVWDVLDGVDDPVFGGSVALLGVTRLCDVLIA
jgi:Ca2+-binding RTX toxin-like protein